MAGSWSRRYGGVDAGDCLCPRSFHPCALPHRRMMCSGYVTCTARSAPGRQQGGRISTLCAEHVRQRGNSSSTRAGATSEGCITDREQACSPAACLSTPIFCPCRPRQIPRESSRGASRCSARHTGHPETCQQAAAEQGRVVVQAALVLLRQRVLPSARGLSQASPGAIPTLPTTQQLIV